MPTTRRHQRTPASLSPDHIQALINGYKTGGTVYELAARFGIHRTTVSQHLHRAGVTMRRQGLDGRQVDQAVRQYQQGYSLARVGARSGADAETVRQALRARGIQLRAAWDRG